LYIRRKPQGITDNKFITEVANIFLPYCYQNRLQSQRALLLQGTESLNRATQSIERSHRIAAETDQIGSEIIEELGEQRDQLERTKSRVSLGNV